MDTKKLINSSLKVLGIAGMAGISVVAPNALLGLAVIMKKKPVKRANYQRILAELKRQGLVHITNKDDSYHFTLTPKGIYRLQQTIIDELTIEVPKKWDKKWRVVAFDVPVKFSAQRTEFVRRLRGMGFMMVQKSMWVHPAYCFDQIEQLAGHYNVMRYCTLFEINKIDEQSARKLTRHFFST